MPHPSILESPASFNISIMIPNFKRWTITNKAQIISVTLQIAFPCSSFINWWILYFIPLVNQTFNYCFLDFNSSFLSFQRWDDAFKKNRFYQVFICHSIFDFYNDPKKDRGHKETILWCHSWFMLHLGLRYDWWLIYEVDFPKLVQDYFHLF